MLVLYLKQVNAIINCVLGLVVMAEIVVRGISHKFNFSARKDTFNLGVDKLRHCISFLGLPYKWSQTGCLKTTEINFLIILEAVGQKSSCQHLPKALRGKLSLFLPASGESRNSLACGYITPISISEFTYPFFFFILVYLL